MPLGERERENMENDVTDGYIVCLIKTTNMDAELEPTTLGQKRQLYNECVKGSEGMGTLIISHHIEGDDVEKMMAIDIACLDKNLRFVLNTLVAEDILYVSRVIKQSTWLITDKKYATIINPEYLRSNLYPKMTTKAIIKLKKHIRLHLKDEIRVEAFYNDENDIEKRLKWLPTCSLPFIEQEVKKHATKIDVHLFKRLCQKSITIFEILTNITEEITREKMEIAIFILYKDVDKYLTAVEKICQLYELPNFGVKGTQVVMKYDPKRIINKINTYSHCIDMPTFAKYLKKDEIKDILYKFAELFSKNSHIELWDDIKHNIKYFIQHMPTEERFNFVKAVFIDKIHINNSDEVNYDTEEIKKMANLFKVLDIPKQNAHLWYQFAPFDIALSKIKILIRDEQDICFKYHMLDFLADCAGSDLLRLRELLQYYHDKHINDKFEHKHKFISKILSKKLFLKDYNNNWTILDDILESMNDHFESDDNKVIYQNCIECIIVYKIINDEPVLAIVEKKFVFNTLKQFGNKMNQDNKNKLFSYLYNYLFLKLQSTVAVNETEFKNNVDLLFNILQTLNDWNKEIVDFPVLLNTIKEYIILRNRNDWKTDLSKLYNINKTWRKYMFEESISLSPCDEVFLNALKHDPELLVRCKSVVDTTICNDKISLNRFLSKLRIFWSLTLAKDWTNQYLSRLDQTHSHKALVRSLCTILPKSHLQDIIQKYTPKEAKINWDEIDGTIISMQRNIAKNMHIARPQPSPDTILSYAKGDYVQYALPSLLAIFYNLSTIKSNEFIMKLLDSPVSLQKHGLRLATKKLKSEEIKKHFHNIWNATKNATIRTILFNFAHDMLCKEKDPTKIQEFWDLLAMFIDGLSFEEDKKIYEVLNQVDQIPLNVKAEYVMKSYNFMKQLISEADSEREHYETIISKLIVNTKEIMVQKYPDFIADILLESMPRLQKMNSYISQELFEVMSANLFITKDEEIQSERFAKILLPFMQLSFNAWEDKTTKRQFKSLLQQLRLDLIKYSTDSNVIVPLKMFICIQNEMEKKLTVPENYILLTEWKLTTGFTKLLYNLAERNDWESICLSLAPEFGKVCMNYLKEDVEMHFPLIYELFSRALKTMLSNLFEKNILRLICTNMLSDKNFIPAYLAVLKICPKYQEKDELTQYISEHSSIEIKIHYSSQFEDYDS